MSAAREALIASTSPPSARRSRRRVEGGLAEPAINAIRLGLNATARRRVITVPVGLTSDLDLHPNPLCSLGHWVDALQGI